MVRNLLLLIFTCCALHLSAQIYSPVESNEIFFIYKFHSFPGGDVEAKKFFARQLHYPFWKRIFGIDEEVLAGFRIIADGRIKDIHLVKGSAEPFNKSVKNVLEKLPRLIHPDMSGNITCLYRCSVNFQKPIFRKSVITYDFRVIAIRNGSTWEYFVADMPVNLSLARPYPQNSRMNW